MLTTESFHVVHPTLPRLITMDDWSRAVFLAADGEHTVEEFLAETCDGMPTSDAAQVRTFVPDIVARLVGDGLIEEVPSPSPLPFYYAKSMTEYDRKDAADAMHRDGVIPHDATPSSPGPARLKWARLLRRVWGARRGADR